MDSQFTEIIARLQALEYKVQNQELSSKDSILEMKAITTDLRTIVNSLDKDMAIQEEKRLMLSYQVASLEKDVADLQELNAKSTTNKSSFVEKVVLAIFGSAIGAIFSYLGSR